MTGNRANNQTPMTYAEFERFMTWYYQAPVPERAPAALAFAVRHVVPLSDEHSRDVVRYHFQRIAQLAPSVVEGYAAAIPWAAGRRSERFVTSLVRSLQSRPGVEPLTSRRSLAARARYIARRAKLPADVPIMNALDRPIEEPGDLDFLWGEFSVTGSETAVIRIIDVLDDVDMIRARLAIWYTTRPRVELLRRRKCRAIERATGITYDGSSDSILPADDLDLFPTWADDGFIVERWKTLRKVLPFRLGTVEAKRTITKCAARWSIESNARQNPEVLDICRRQAAIREGPSSVSLLRIVAACSSTPSSRGGTR